MTVKSGDLAIHKAKTFVVDEADMTLDMGFLETVIKIAGALKDLQFNRQQLFTKLRTVLEILVKSGNGKI